MSVFTIIISMTNKIRLVIDKLTVHPKYLFLIDSLGAFLTAFILAGILARFEHIFGMPQTVLYCLSIVAIIYAAYSLCCYFFISKIWRPYLLVIAVANTMYCFVTIGVVYYNYHLLTSLGLIYFILELLVMSSLIFIELKVITNNLDSKS
jgi:hypothetical protein